MSIYLPEELVTEILYRVPVKHLVKFLVVSKPWYILIASPNFKETHLNRTRQQKIRSNSSPLLIRGYTHSDKKEHYVVYSDDEEESVTELSFPLKSQIGYRVVGGCDGLVCLSHDMLTTREPSYLWNPSVRKYIELPSPMIYPHSPHKFVLGFGTDRRGDYKVVWIVYHKMYLKMCQLGCFLPPEMEVYSLGTGLWRRILNVSVDLFLAECISAQASLNGSLHWISDQQPKNRDGDPFRSLLLRFDLENEVFSVMMLPDFVWLFPVRDLAVNVCQGNLAVMAQITLVTYSSCSIWVMKQYGVFESWTRLFTVNLAGWTDRVVGFHRSGSVFVAKGAGELVLLDPKSNKSQGLGVLGSSRSFYVCDFEESLVLLGRQDAIAEKAQGSEDNSNDDDDSLELESGRLVFISYHRDTDGMTQFSCP